MAKSFTYKDARELIRFHKSLISQLRNGIKLVETTSGDVKKNISFLTLNHYYDKLANALMEGTEDYEDDVLLQSNLVLVYRYRQASKDADACSALLNANQTNIEGYIHQLSFGSNPVSWLFASKNKKQSAEEAFQQLTAIKEGDYARLAQSVLSDIANIRGAYSTTVFEDYQKNKEGYKKDVLRLSKDITTGNKTLLPLFASYQKQYQDTVNILNAMKSGLKEAGEKIKSSIDEWLALEMVNVLRSVPVDEIGREGNRIKIKCLKDAGFQNLADVFGASSYQIASCYGISQDSAYTIKTIVDNYAKKVREGLKIKFSVDDQSKAATKVILAIYVYLQKKKCCDEIHQLEQQYDNTLNAAFTRLYQVNNGCTLPFESDETIGEIKKAFDFIKETLSTKYIPTTDNIRNEYRKAAYSKSASAWKDFAERSIQYYNVIEDVYPGVLGTNDSIYGLPEQLAREIQDQCFFPDGLLCQLRKYQEWGVKYILHQEKVLLGDEMGLGKTVEAIAAMVSLKNTGATHFVVVCPASVVTNWCREIVKHSRLRVTKIHGTGKSSAFQSWLKTGGVAVTNYESVSYLKLDPSFRFSMLVVDEAHFIKNPDARRSINTRNLTHYTDRVLFMTGTALENKVDEMISLISVLRPDIASSIENLAFMSAAPQFREKIAPVYYRRKREDVLTELPDKIESEEWCTLNPEEEQAYEEAVLNKDYNGARRVSWNIDDLHKSAKANRLKEIVDEAESEGRKVLVFSFFLDTIAKIHEFLKGRCLNPINGSVNVNRRQEILDEFEKAPAGTVLLAQITSGGTGLNIQAASVVVICEPQFKPSIENQAISRAYRMGQSRKVLVYRLLAEDTIDEAMVEVLKTKQEIFDAFADKSVAAKMQEAEIDDKTFGKIIEQEIERIKKKNAESPSIKEEVPKPTTEATEPSSSFEHPPVSDLKTGKDYYHKIMKMNYHELVQHLLNRYGPSKFNYFTGPSCTTKNKNASRAKEGLFCHHIDEDKAIMLSNDEFAAQNPFAYQKADRLVYCNFLEHFLLHILIFEESNDPDADPLEIKGAGGAINFICRQINDFYGGYEYKRQWLITATSLIKNDYDSYIVMLKRLWEDVENSSLSMIIKKEQLAEGWDRNVYQNILNDLG